MKVRRQHHARRWLTLVAATLWGAAASAASSGGGGTTLASYSFEIAPLIGINLPYDVYGADGLLNTYGVQAGLSLDGPSSVTVSGLYHSKEGDWAWTVDGGYRHEINSALFNAFFDVGLHYSRFNLDVDRKADGTCIPASCATDSGSYVGIYLGSGIIIPLAPMTLARLGFRFYNNPQAWVLVSAGLGFRF